MVGLPLSCQQRRAFVDSSAYLALLDRDDRNHAVAVDILEWLADHRYRLYTTNVMLIECHALILSVLGTRFANRFLREITDSSTTIIRVRSGDEEQAKQILYRYED